MFASKAEIITVLGEKNFRKKPAVDFSPFMYNVVRLWNRPFLSHYFYYYNYI